MKITWSSSIALFSLTMMSVCLIMFSCGVDEATPQKEKSTDPATSIPDSAERMSMVAPAANSIDSVITIMVLPAANGYEYSTSNYDLEKVLAQTLQNIPSCRVVPVPYPKLKGRGYNGVFRKEDCSWVMQHTDADFIMLSRIEGELRPLTEAESGQWGYRTRLVNTRTNTQAEFIADHDLKRFTDLEISVRKKLPEAWHDHIKY